MHECGLHAQALISWPDGDHRAGEVAKTTAQFEHHKRMLWRALFDMIGPIEQLLGIDEESKA